MREIITAICSCIVWSHFSTYSNRASLIILNGCRRSLQIVMNRIRYLVNFPLSIQCDLVPINRSQIVNRCFILIAFTRPICVCIPTDKVMIRIRKGIGCQVFFFIIFKDLVLHLLIAIRIIFIEFDGIVDRRPNCEEIFNRFCFISSDFSNCTFGI